MRIGGTVLAALVATGLSGCSLDDFSSVDLWLYQTCHPDSDVLIESADWAAAETIEMRVRQGEYTPMLLFFGQGKPYVLRIENADDVSRIFRAEEFFGAIAPKSLTIAGHSHEACVSYFEMGPGETGEFKFVAARDGRYDFADNALPYGVMLGAPGTGVISIR